MNLNAIKTMLVVLMVVSASALAQASAGRFSIEISSSQSRLAVGEPYFVRLIYRYEAPNISRRTGQIAPSIKTDHLQVHVRNNGREVRRASLWPVRLLGVDSAGREYRGTAMIVFDDGLADLVVFNEPGQWTCRIGEGDVVSNVLSVAVDTPSTADRKAMELLLQDRLSIPFLLGGAVGKQSERASRRACMESIVGQCDGTFLARWAAARLGLEWFGEFRSKHKSIETFRDRKTAGLVSEPLLGLARGYLEVGQAVPDELPIREEVLEALIQLENADGNDDKVLIYMDELISKYPTSTRGRKAAKWRASLIEHMSRSSGDGSSKKP